MIQNELSSDLISTRAYQLWENSGTPDGQQLENWLQAERELLLDAQNQKARGEIATGPSAAVASALLPTPSMGMLPKPAAPRGFRAHARVN